MRDCRKLSIKWKFYKIKSTLIIETKYYSKVKLGIIKLAKVHTKYLKASHNENLEHLSTVYKSGQFLLV